MSKFVLVTGGAGYIGSHTVVSLVQNGYTPVIVDDFRNANRAVLKGLESILGKIPLLHEIDVCNKESLDALFKQYPFDGAIHFAALKSVGESVTAPLKYYRNNILGLVNVLECMIKHRVNNFVFSSSCTVYGEPKGQKEVTESTPK
ncbi:MAG: NAD-dependent epimerase/dehydratase family protein, partial [Bacteroidetes bacterium]|nr:NAD-dependent epimerase/dehydratase family protein [Bacteroidota bacterium]